MWMSLMTNVYPGVNKTSPEILPMSLLRALLWTVLFAVAFAWVEASVVVYLRDIYYPQGFSFPLQSLSVSRIPIELVRECSTLVMLAAIGILAGTTRWQRFAYFAVAFGVWDIFFYVWLKVALDWPASVFDWDILFLLPLPWIGPVLAPVLVSLGLIFAGLLILRQERVMPFRPTGPAWTLGSAGSVIVLWTFMHDTDATLHGSMPAAYPFEVFSAGLACYAAALWVSMKGAHRRITNGNPK